MTRDAFPAEDGTVDLLVVADSLEGGLGSSVLRHVRYLADRGWRIAVVAPTGSPRPSGAVHVRQIPMPRSATDISGMLRAAVLTRAFRRRCAPQLVHAHGLRSQLIVVAGGQRPWVTRHGGGSMRGLGWHVALARRLTEPIAPWFATQAYSVAPARGRWRTALTASPRLAALRLAPPETMQEPALFVWVGRLEAPKRPEMFVDAVALAAETVECCGVMLGSGPLADELQQRIAHARAPVRLLGHQTDLMGWYAAARAVCLFSQYEGLPFSVEEAMWCGRSAVVSDLPGIRWFAGSSVLYADDVQTAASMLVRLADRTEAAALGAAAARLAHSRLNPDDPLPQLEKEYLRAGLCPRSARNPSAGK